MKLPAPPRHHWIHSPLYDLAFFSTIWWIPLFLAVQSGFAAAFGGALFFILFHAGLRIPHFVATLQVTYLRRENWAHYRDRWITYFAIPALILALYGLSAALPGRGALQQALASVALAWGLQHIAFQNYGILSLYRSRARQAPDAWIPRLEKGVFWALFALSAIEGAVRPWFSGPGVELFLRAAIWGARGALALFVATYLARLFHLRRSRPVSLPALLFFVSAVASMTYWPFYNRIGEAGTGPLLFFYVFNGHHCIAYLGLTHLMQENAGEAAGRPGRSGSPAAYARYLVPLIAVSAALLAVSGAYLNPGFAGLDALTGFFVAHYFIESRVWKFQDPVNRTLTLPLLRQPAPADAGRSAAATGSAARIKA